MLVPRTEFCSLPASPRGGEAGGQVSLLGALPSAVGSKYKRLPSFIIPSKNHLESPLLEIAEVKVTELSKESQKDTRGLPGRPYPPRADPSQHSLKRWGSKRSHTHYVRDSVLGGPCHV